MSVSLSVFLLSLCAMSYFASCGATLYFCKRKNFLVLFAAYLPGMLAILGSSYILPNFSSGVQLIGLVVIFWAGVSLVIGVMTTLMGKVVNRLLIYPWVIGNSISRPILLRYARHELNSLLERK